MNEDRQKKLAKLDNISHRKEVLSALFSDDDIDKIQQSLDTAYEKIDKAINEKEYKAIDINSQQFQLLQSEVKALGELINGGVNVNNLEPITKSIEKIKFVLPEIKIPEIKIPATKVITNDIYDEYKAADSEYGENTSYHGFLNRAGKWFILRQNGDKVVSYRYATGEITYTQAWRERNLLDYSLYNEVQI